MFILGVIVTLFAYADSQYDGELSGDLGRPLGVHRDAGGHDLQRVDVGDAYVWQASAYVRAPSAEISGATLSLWPQSTDGLFLRYHLPSQTVKLATASLNDFGASDIDMQNHRITGISGIDAVTAETVYDLVVGDDLKIGDDLTVTSDLMVGRNITLSGTDPLLSLYGIYNATFPTMFLQAYVDGMKVKLLTPADISHSFAIDADAEQATINNCSLHVDGDIVADNIDVTTEITAQTGSFTNDVTAYNLYIDDRLYAGEFYSDTNLYLDHDNTASAYIAWGTTITAGLYIMNIHFDPGTGKMSFTVNGDQMLDLDSSASLVTVYNASMYVQSGVSAEYYIDRCDYPGEGVDALSALRSIQPVQVDETGWGQLDHSSLPAAIYRRSQYTEEYRQIKDKKTGKVLAKVKREESPLVDEKNPKKKDIEALAKHAGLKGINPDDLEIETIEEAYEEEGRDIGNSVSLNSAAIVELLERVEAVEAENAELRRLIGQ